MGKFLFDKDVRLTPLRNKTIGVLGYGNQGRAQALNLRDSGCDVIIGNRRDRYRKTAVEDGFDVSPISEVVPRADILIIAIPDEIQQQVYEKHIRDHLLPGQGLRPVVHAVTHPAVHAIAHPAVAVAHPAVGLLHG